MDSIGRLQVIKRNGKCGSSFPLERDARLFVGRSDECQIRVKIPTVSSRHCVLQTFTEAGVPKVYVSTVKDCETLVNDAPIKMRTELKSGDSFQIADRVFRFIESEQLDESTAPAPLTPVNVKPFASKIPTSNARRPATTTKSGIPQSSRMATISAKKAPATVSSFKARARNLATSGGASPSLKGRSNSNIAKAATPSPRAAASGRTPKGLLSLTRPTISSLVKVNISTPGSPKSPSSQKKSNVKSTSGSRPNSTTSYRTPKSGAKLLTPIPFKTTTPVSVKKVVTPVSMQKAATPLSARKAATPASLKKVTPVSARKAATPVSMQKAATPVSLKKTCSPMKKLSPRLVKTRTPSSLMKSSPKVGLLKNKTPASLNNSKVSARKSIVKVVGSPMPSTPVCMLGEKKGQVETSGRRSRSLLREEDISRRMSPGQSPETSTALRTPAVTPAAASPRPGSALSPSILSITPDAITRAVTNILQNNNIFESDDDEDDTSAYEPGDEQLMSARKESRKSVRRSAESRSLDVSNTAEVTSLLEDVVSESFAEMPTTSNKARKSRASRAVSFSANEKSSPTVASELRKTPLPTEKRDSTARRSSRVRTPKLQFDFHTPKPSVGTSSESDEGGSTAIDDIAAFNFVIPPTVDSSEQPDFSITDLFDEPMESQDTPAGAEPKRVSAGKRKSANSDFMFDSPALDVLASSKRKSRRSSKKSTRASYSSAGMIAPSPINTTPSVLKSIASTERGSGSTARTSIWGTPDTTSTEDEEVQQPESPEFATTPTSLTPLPKTRRSRSAKKMSEGTELSFSSTVSSLGTPAVKQASAKKRGRSSSTPSASSGKKESPKRRSRSVSAAKPQLKRIMQLKGQRKLSGPGFGSPVSKKSTAVMSTPKADVSTTESVHDSSSMSAYDSLASSPAAPSEMAVSPISGLQTPGSPTTRVSFGSVTKKYYIKGAKISPTKGRVSTPATLKRLLKQPQSDRSDKLLRLLKKSPLRGVKKHTMMSPQVRGVKALLDTATREAEASTAQSPRLSGIKNMFDSTPTQNSPRLAGVKAMVDRESNESDLREMPTPRYAGVRAVMKPKKVQKTPQMRGMREMFQEQTESEPVDANLKRIMKSPASFYSKSPRLSGVGEMLQSPVEVRKAKGSRSVGPIQKVSTPVKHHTPHEVGHPETVEHADEESASPALRSSRRLPSAKRLAKQQTKVVEVEAVEEKVSPKKRTARQQTEQAEAEPVQEKVGPKKRTARQQTKKAETKPVEEKVSPKKKPAATRATKRTKANSVSESEMQQKAANDETAAATPKPARATRRVAKKDEEAVTKTEPVVRKRRGRAESSEKELDTSTTSVQSATSSSRRRKKVAEEVVAELPAIVEQSEASPPKRARKAPSTKKGKQAKPVVEEPEPVVKSETPAKSKTTRSKKTSIKVESTAEKVSEKKPAARGRKAAATAPKEDAPVEVKAKAKATKGKTVKKVVEEESAPVKKTTRRAEKKEAVEEVQSIRSTRARAKAQK